MSDFNPPLCQCLICDTKLKSSYQGEFVSCECGESFVDQTAHYSRYGGSARSLDHLLMIAFLDIAKKEGIDISDLKV